MMVNNNNSKDNKRSQTYPRIHFFQRRFEIRLVYFQLLHFGAKGFNINSSGGTHIPLNVINRIWRSLRLLVQPNKHYNRKRRNKQ